MSLLFGRHGLLQRLEIPKLLHRDLVGMYQISAEAWMFVKK